MRRTTENAIIKAYNLCLNEERTSLYLRVEFQLNNYVVNYTFTGANITKFLDVVDCLELSFLTNKAVRLYLEGNLVRNIGNIIKNKWVFSDWEDMI